ncbi:MAG TPA: hypothetical protein PLT13_04195 [Spirochaetota bacterium]|nr:hypothetical protein [Spirochaetota bacterium]
MKKMITFLFFMVLVSVLSACSSMPELKNVQPQEPVWQKKPIWGKVNRLTDNQALSFTSGKSYVINPKDGAIIKELNDKRGQYFLSGSEKLDLYLSAESNLTAYSLSTHEKKYEIETGFFTARSTWSFNEKMDMILLSDKGVVAYKASTGAKLWKTDEIKSVPHQYVIDEKTGNMIGITWNYTVIIDLKQGKLLKKIETDFSRPIVFGTIKDRIEMSSDGRYLYVMSPERTSCIDLVEGKQLWSNGDVGMGGDYLKLKGFIIQLDSNRILAYGQNDNLALVIERHSGKVLKKIKTSEDMRAAFSEDGKLILVDANSIYIVNQSTMEIENQYKFSKINKTSEIVAGIQVNSNRDDNSKDIVIFTEEECFYFDLIKMEVKKKISLGKEYELYSLPEQLSDKSTINNFFVLATAFENGPRFLTFLYSIDLAIGKVNYCTFLNVVSAQTSQINTYVFYPESNIYVTSGGWLIGYKLK